MDQANSLTLYPNTTQPVSGVTYSVPWNYSYPVFSFMISPGGTLYRLNPATGQGWQYDGYKWQPIPEEVA